MKLFEKKTYSIALTKSNIFWIAFIVIILLTFMVSALMSRGLMSGESAGSAVELDNIRLIQFDPPAEDQRIITVKTTAGEMRVMLFSNECPLSAEAVISAAEKDTFRDAAVTPTESGAALFIQIPEPGEYTVEVHKNLWPFKGAMCMDPRGNLLFVNTVEFTDEMRESLSSQTGLADVCNGFLEHGGIPNISQQYTVVGQIIEGMDVLEALAASDGTEVIEGIEADS
ncbi:MAG: peptidylprolyl isomerase [Huintestinicola sp.]